MIEWKPTTAQYTTGKDAYLGRIRVGWAGYSSMRSKGDPEKYAGSILLPGVKVDGKFMTEEDAMKRVAEVVALWVRASGLNPPKPL